MSARKPCILFLIDDFCGPEGGTEQHLLFLQRELPRNLLDLHFAVLTRIQRFDADAFPVRPRMLVGQHRGWRGAFERLRRLASFVRTEEIDVVHAFSRTSELYACMAVKLARRGRVLGLRHNVGYWHTWRSRWIARAATLLGAHYAANCEAARQFTAKVEWVAPQRIAVVGNPIVTGRVADGLAAPMPRESLGIHDGERVVAMVATVRPIKDYATFLRAARLVLERHPTTRFLAIGVQEPAYAAEMRRLACALGIDRQVGWVGPVRNPLTILPHVDVAVLSSRSEALSNAVLEYAAAGVATVATDVGGMREIVADGETGFLVPPEQPSVMADRICRLLDDDGLRRSFGEQARQTVLARYSQERILEQYVSLYRRLTDIYCGAGVPPGGLHCQEDRHSCLSSCASRSLFSTDRNVCPPVLSPTDKNVCPPILNNFAVLLGVPPALLAAGEAPASQRSVAS